MTLPCSVRDVRYDDTSTATTLTLHQGRMTLRSASLHRHFPTTAACRSATTTALTGVRPMRPALPLHDDATEWAWASTGTRWASLPDAPAHGDHADHRTHPLVPVNQSPAAIIPDGLQLRCVSNAQPSPMDSHVAMPDRTQEQAHLRSTQSPHRRSSPSQSGCSPPEEGRATPTPMR